MGGELGVVSAQGLGSRFWFELPLPFGRRCGQASPSRRADRWWCWAGLGAAAVARLDALGFRAAPWRRSRRRSSWRSRAARCGSCWSPAATRRSTWRGCGELRRRPGADPGRRPDAGRRAGRAAGPDARRPAGNGRRRLSPLCLRAALLQPAGAGPADRAVAPGPPARPLSILVAEDNRTNQKVIGPPARARGHKVRVVGDGQGAVDAIDAERFDAVLMDINMPDMDGIETVKLLRFMRKPAELPPIVALSADATPETQAACREIGFSAYLLKPIDTRVLTRTLAELPATDRTGGPGTWGGAPDGGRRGRPLARPGRSARPPGPGPVKLASLAGSTRGRVPRPGHRRVPRGRRRLMQRSPKPPPPATAAPSATGPALRSRPATSAPPACPRCA